MNTSTHYNGPFPCSAQRPLPAKTAVVVIGGGVIGVTAALSLARWNIPVVLLEKGVVAAEQSSRNWGWVRIQGRDAAEVPLMLASRDQWRQINERLDSDIGFRQIGCTYVAANEAELSRRAQFLETATQFGLDTRLISRRELEPMLGPNAATMAGGIQTPSDYCAEPALAVPAMARLAADQSVQIFEHCAVRALQLSAGRVSGVVTEHGPIACEQVVLAGGAWSRTFLENHRVAFPQLAVMSSAQRSAPAALPFGSAVGAPGISIRPRLDGGVTMGRTSTGTFELIPAAFRHLGAFWPVLRDPDRSIKLRASKQFFGVLGRRRWQPDQVSPFEALRVFDPTPDTAVLNDMLTSAQRTFPALAQVGIAQRWGGMIDVMPDELPVIDNLNQLPGLTVATGFSGHGFGLGPGAGLLAAQLAANRTPQVDPAPFAAARFKALANNAVASTDQTLVQTR